jgi:radical SAM protein with 4Fe4S-binding SPASM domain
MPSLIQQISAKARQRLVPLRLHMDLTWRCNERCIHCYLGNRAAEEMTTAEVARALDQSAEAGALFLILSGGEIMLRRDIFEIVAHARELQFDVKIKTNGLLIGAGEAERFAALGVRRADISIYSHRPGTHDAITLVSGSLERSLAACRALIASGISVRISAPIMRRNAEDCEAIRKLAAGLGAEAQFDAKITPCLSGDCAPLSLSVSDDVLPRVLAEVGPAVDLHQVGDSGLSGGSPCGAGISSFYISPSGDVMPCVEYPMACGNLRSQTFGEIWHSSPAFAAIRAVRNRDLPVCSACPNQPVCARCPGLAYIEGDALGASSLDCRMAFARTGIPSPAMKPPTGGPPPTSPESTSATEDLAQ